MTQKERPGITPSNITSRVLAIKDLPPKNKAEILEQFPASPGRPLSNKINSPSGWDHAALVFTVFGFACFAAAIYLDQTGGPNDNISASASSAQSFGTEDDLIEARSKRAAQAAEIQPNPQSRAELIEKTLKGRMSEYKYSGLLNGKSWQVIELPEPVTMQVTTTIGVLLRQVADRIIEGNLVPTFAPGDQPQIKHWKWGEEVEQEVKYFVLEEDKQSHRAVYFAVTPEGDINQGPIHDSGDSESPYAILKLKGEEVLLGQLLAKKGVVFHSPF